MIVKTLIYAIVAILLVCDDSYSIDIENSANYRLPKDVIPTAYNLSIYTYLGDANNFTFNGHLQIDITVLNNVNRIVLNLDGLTIHKEKSEIFDIEEESEVEISDQTYDTENQFYILAANLHKGNYTLQLQYTGEIEEKLVGFYRSKYESNGVTEYVYVTNFEPTDARKAFPCFDEPHFKAPFHIHIGSHDNLKVHSNTDMERITRISDDYVIVSMQKTPPMSTYLVAWVVHNFTEISSTVFPSIKMWARESVIPDIRYAVDEGAKLYGVLKEWLDVENPLEKNDFIVMPVLEKGGMENWGMITFKESFLTVNNGTTLTQNYLETVTMLCHEFAHSWFGNLVTHHFWDSIWLTEGLTSFFQFYGVNLLHPEWKVMDYFAARIQQHSLGYDTNGTYAPLIRTNLGSPKSIKNTLQFDIYSKAPSIIRMVSHVLGIDTFRRAIQMYLRKGALKDVESSDLYQALDASLPEDRQVLPRNMSFEDILRSWTTQSGYPTLKVRRNYTSNSVVITQERLGDGIDVTDDRDPLFWIPLSYVKTSTVEAFNETSPREWFGTRSMVLENVNADEWIIFNVQQTGYYRTDYDARNWKMIADYLDSPNYSKIPAVNRAALLEDAFFFANAEQYNFSIPFTIMRYLGRETEYEPWFALKDHINDLLTNYKSTDVYPRLESFLSRLVTPVYNKLTLYENDNEDLRTKLLREIVSGIACQVNIKSCIDQASTLFQKWIANPEERISADVRRVVYCVGVSQGNNSDWYTVWKRYLEADLDSEKENLFAALGCVVKPAMLEQFMDLWLANRSSLPNLNFSKLLSGVFNYESSTNAVLDYLRNHADYLTNKTNAEIIEIIMDCISYEIKNEAGKQVFEKFVKEHHFALGYKRSLITFAKKVFTIYAAISAKLNVAMNEASI